MAAVVPAAAQAEYFQIVNKESAWCLEGNQAGDVYIDPCQPADNLQLWERWDGGWTRHVATGLCLKGNGQFAPASIHLAPCAWGELLMNWLHWYGGWYQRAGFGENAPECLARQPGSESDVTGVACQNPNGPNPPGELWYAMEVSPVTPPPPAPPPVDPCEPVVSSPGLRLRVGFRRSRRVATVAYGRRLRVNGSLRTGDGSPVANASFCVGLTHSSGSSVRSVGSISTDGRGRFSYVLGRGASRRVWFIHRGVGQSAAASVRVNVRAPVSLRASRRFLRNGDSVVLRGRLRGGIRTRDLLVELQAKRGRKWVTFALSRTKSGGRFSYAYRFTRTVGRQTYQLRARVAAQKGSPFATGASPSVRVRVVG